MRSALPLLVLGAMLALPTLPAPGSTGRGRAFCDAWLALPTPTREEVLIRAERAEQGGHERSCREGLRSGLRLTLDAECRNWSQLMDFEVRQLVDRSLARCEKRPTPGS